MSGRPKSKGFADGPATRNFTPIALKGNTTFADIARSATSEPLSSAVTRPPQGEVIGWGIPFDVGRPYFVKDKPAVIELPGLKAQWLVFLHAADVKPVTDPEGQIITPVRGEGWLGQKVADYVFLYEDGSEIRVPIRRRYQIYTLGTRWGEETLEAVNFRKPYPVKASITHTRPDWGRNQTRAVGGGGWGWFSHCMWAWENPRPSKPLIGVGIEPVDGAVLISGLSAGKASSRPLRWRTRRKAVLKLPRGMQGNLDIAEDGLHREIRLDMGQVISATARPLYPDGAWAQTYANKVPEISKREVIVEYTSHEDASFHLWNGRRIPVAKVESKCSAGPIRHVTPATERVKLRVVEKGTKKPVVVKLHVHGEAGEYLAPVDRHRIINPAWFEDYSPDFAHQRVHLCTYIPGETTIDLPVGRVYIEVTKGFEIRPVRKAVQVKRGAKEVTVEIEKVLPWRERGWVTADTHVHFLSPQTAMLEGAGEGVNVVNLLASQWGELMTNVGDFDGRTTHGSKEAGGDGEYLVRVGTENRQRMLGHISLLGYKGDIIAPMTTGGPDESALGDPVGCLLTEWGRQCKAQGGLVVIPHFPGPRLENAAAIVTGNVDAIEASSRTFLYRGINPYALLDWYRYLNCGYAVAIAGGTDKMEAETAVGTLRTYALMPRSKGFTYEAWKDAVRRANTFVTCGPLVEFEVDGTPMGGRVKMPAGGGTVDVTWHAASCTMPMTRVELVVNGEVRESKAVRGDEAQGAWRVKVDRSAWMALLVRGRYADKPEIIAAHTSAVMCDVKRTKFFAAADAVTILEQIEGALAYIELGGTREDARRYKEMRLELEAAARSIHNGLHEAGHYHEHRGGARHKA